MATETIAVNMGGGRSVNVSGETRYTGTRSCGCGGRNIEDYDVVILGHECRGEWDGDARHNTYVESPPAELRRALLGRLRSQEAAQERRDREATRAAEIRFYGRVISPEL